MPINTSLFIQSLLQQGTRPNSNPFFIPNRVQIQPNFVPFLMPTFNAFNPNSTVDGNFTMSNLNSFMAVLSLLDTMNNVQSNDTETPDVNAPATTSAPTTSPTTAPSATTAPVADVAVTTLENATSNANDGVRVNNILSFWNDYNDGAPVSDRRTAAEMALAALDAMENDATEMSRDAFIYFGTIANLSDDEFNQVRNRFLSDGDTDDGGMTQGEVRDIAGLAGNRRFLSSADLDELLPNRPRGTVITRDLLNNIINAAPPPPPATPAPVAPTPAPPTTPPVAPPPVDTPAPPTTPPVAPPPVETPAPPTTPRYDFGDGADDFYNLILNRPGEASGLEFWRQGLDNGLSLKDMMVGFMTSDEFNNRQLPNAEKVKIAYRGILGREAEAGGLEHWTNLLNQGMSVQDLVTNIFNSDEKRLSYIDRAYSTVLGRQGEEAGRQGHLEGLRNGGSGIDMLKSFFNSPEYQGQNNSPEETIKRVYRAMLGREPEQAGLDHWVGVLNTSDINNVITNIATSPEYRRNQYLGPGVTNSAPPTTPPVAPPPVETPAPVAPPPVTPAPPDPRIQERDQLRTQLSGVQDQLNTNRTRLNQAQAGRDLLVQEQTEYAAEVNRLQERISHLNSEKTRHQNIVNEMNTNIQNRTNYAAGLRDYATRVIEGERIPWVQNAITSWQAESSTRENRYNQLHAEWMAGDTSKYQAMTEALASWNQATQEVNQLRQSLINERNSAADHRRRADAEDALNTQDAARRQTSQNMVQDIDNTLPGILTRQRRYNELYASLVPGITDHNNQIVTLNQTVQDLTQQAASLQSRIDELTQQIGS